MADIKKKPAIIFTKYSPYTVIDLENLENTLGNPLKVDPVFSLCRCGAWSLARASTSPSATASFRVSVSFCERRGGLTL